MRDDSTASSRAAGSAPDRLYPRLLGPDWDALHPAVQRAHTDLSLTHAEGTCRVSRASGWLIGCILDLLRVPRASDSARVHLAVEQRGAVERWHRVFEGRPLVTRQTEAPGGLLAERIGILEFRFRLLVTQGEMVFRQQSLAVCLGSWRVPVPRWLAPRIAAREGPAGAAAAHDTAAGRPDRTTVEVRVTTPGGSLLFSYRGAVRWGA